LEYINRKAMPVTMTGAPIAMSGAPIASWTQSIYDAQQRRFGDRPVVREWTYDKGIVKELNITPPGQQGASQLQVSLLTNQAVLSWSDWAGAGAQKDN
jgi:hypothetical protein